MLNYVEYLDKYINMPAKVIIFFVVAFFIMQAVGEIIEFCGKVAPGFMKVRKGIAAKKQEEREMRETLKETKDALARTESLLLEVHAHYDDDNIAKRDLWIQSVNDRLDANTAHWRELSEKLDQNNADTLEIKIENMRTTILDMAARAINPSVLISHEEFRRVFRIHSRYKQIIEEKHLENGEVDIAITVIEAGYRERLKENRFVEDMCVYAQNG